jgi:hypothetical protein
MQLLVNQQVGNGILYQLAVLMQVLLILVIGVESTRGGSYGGGRGSDMRKQGLCL